MKVKFNGITYFYEDFTYHFDKFGYKSPIDISFLPAEVIELFLELGDDE